MQLVELFAPERVSASLRAEDKPAVLSELAALFQRGTPKLDAARIYEVLALREALASTGVGSGVAIPHGRLEGLTHTVAALGIHRAGVPFEAVDGCPAHVFVVVLAPERRASDHLKALARISRLLRRPAVREALLELTDPDAILDLIAREDGPL